MGADDQNKDLVEPLQPGEAEGLVEQVEPGISGGKVDKGRDLIFTLVTNILRDVASGGGDAKSLHRLVTDAIGKISSADDAIMLVKELAPDKIDKAQARDLYTSFLKHMPTDDQLLKFLKVTKGRHEEIFGFCEVKYMIRMMDRAKQMADVVRGEAERRAESIMKRAEEETREKIDNL